MGHLAARGRGAHDPAHRLALRDVVGRGDRVDRRDLVLLDVGHERVAGGGQEPARDGVHLLLLDQAPHLGEGAGGLGVGVLDDDLHLAARDLVAHLFPEEVEAVGHVLAGLGEVAGERTEVADLDRLRATGPGRPDRGGRRGAAHRHQELSPLHGDASSSVRGNGCSRRYTRDGPLICQPCGGLDRVPGQRSESGPCSTPPATSSCPPPSPAPIRVPTGSPRSCAGGASRTRWAIPASASSTWTRWPAWCASRRWPGSTS